VIDKLRHYRTPIFIFGLWAVVNVSLFFPEIAGFFGRYQLARQGEKSVWPYQIRFQPVNVKRSISSQQLDFVEEAMPFLFFEPSISNDNEPLPLLVLLHGAGDRMNVITKQTRVLENYFTNATFQSKHPCFVLGPICPESSDWGGPRETLIFNTSMMIIRDLALQYNIDQSRIYLAGHSMGAYGCFEWLAKAPRMFAAAMPIAGGGNPSNASILAETPMWVIHGDADEKISPMQSIEMVDAIQASGGTVKFTLIKGVAHDSWKHVMLHPQGELDWLFSQSRAMPSIP
jgi:predicted peptidase